jgi:hypothetical protein
VVPALGGDRRWRASFACEADADCSDDDRHACNDTSGQAIGSGITSQAARAGSGQKGQQQQLAGDEAVERQSQKRATGAASGSSRRRSTVRHSVSTA